jgi:hypothetical protein
MARPQVHDVVSTVHDRQPEDNLIELVLDLVDHLHDPKDVIVSASDNSFAAFQELIKAKFNLEDPAEKRRCDQALKHILPVLNPEGSDGHGTVCHHLGNERLSEALIHTVNSGSYRVGDENCKINVAMLVMLDPADQSYDHYLDWVKERCPFLKIYVVWTPSEEPGDSVGIIPRVLEKEEDSIPVIPPDAMYGKVSELARKTRAPLGFAYPAVLACCSVYVPPTDSVRPSIYVGQIGPVQSGKSVGKVRAGQLTGLLDSQGNVISQFCKETTPGSDRGLIKLYAGELVTKPSLLVSDEGRSIMQKGSIENSSLFTVLCELWSKDTAGVVDKKGLDECRVRLSLLLNLKIDSEAEFPKVFSHGSTHGLYSRFLFGYRGNEKWAWSDWYFDKPETIEIRTNPPHFPQTAFDQIHEWRDSIKGNSRHRLAEHALRVCLITASVNGDAIVGEKCVNAALRFMEWQEKIRARFMPASGESEWDTCMAEILQTFGDAPDGLPWSKTCDGKHWHRRFPRALKAIKENLIRDGKLIPNKDNKRFYLRGK